LKCLGQLGLGHTNNVEKVSCIKSLKFGDTGEKVILAACGRESSLVATDQGSLYGFGANYHCQLGFESDGSTKIHPIPVKIASFRLPMSWEQISMGAEHTCALTMDGEVYVWGSNEEGQCGQLRKYNIIKAPRQLRLEYAVIDM
jgi:alpha-tubulin suppressor-like RCC1 family protein